MKRDYSSIAMAIIWLAVIAVVIFTKDKKPTRHHTTTINRYWDDSLRSYYYDTTISITEIQYK